MVVLLLSLLSLLSLSLLCRLITIIIISYSLVDVNTADDSDNGRIIVMITLESITDWKPYMRR